MRTKIKFPKFKFKKYTKFYRPALFVFSLFFIFGFGLFLGVSSWDRQLYVEAPPIQEDSTSHRTLATPEGLNLYSTPLDKMNQDREQKLFGSTKTVWDKGLLGFYLGNFFVPDPHKDSHQFVCQSYLYLEATFVSLGVTVSGDEGSIVVLAPCLMEDEEFIGPFWIPVQKMLRDFVRQSFELPQKETLIHTYGISFSLVSRWLLKSVRFFNSPEEEGLRIDYNPNSLHFELKTQ